MSGDLYACCDERRRVLLAAASAPPNLSGIDYIVVHQGATTSMPTTIEIVLVKALALPAAALTGENISLTGGARYPAPKVDPVVAMQPGGGTVDRYVVTIPGGQPTDYSTYQLSLVAGPNSDAPPSFIDVRLSSVEFSFKIECPSDFDCAPACAAPPDDLPPEPNFDYRIRDYEGFRRQILDRLSELVPNFREDDPVDFTTTLVEALAYRADQQSYRLDWVATEAFLSTARSRTSVTRHARLVDYQAGEGASARVFVKCVFTPNGAVFDGSTLDASTPILARITGLPSVIPASAYRTALMLKPMVFETMVQLKLYQWRNAISFYTWTDDECRLARGATSATILDTSGGAGTLVPGDFLLLEEILSPETGDAADKRVDHRHVVRLTRVTSAQDLLTATSNLLIVEWSDEDALPFDLVIQTRLATALGGSPSIVCAQASGNIVLADHGASAPPAAMLGLPTADMDALRPVLTPSVPREGETWAPVLDRGDISRIEPVNFSATPMQSAAALNVVDAASCLPALQLDDDFATWSVRRDLLESGDFNRDFVIETAIDGRPAFRFGDGINGLPPSPGTLLVPSGRFGLGLEGNIGHDALAHVVLPPLQQAATLTVTNPLPARGGAAPESLADIRIAAPEAFRRQERAVTANDYAWAAMQHPDVANAVAIARWTGAWQTILVYVDRKGGLAVDDAFRRELLAHIEYYRLMGFDVAVHGAVPAPLDIDLLVCAKPNELRSSVGARVRDALKPVGAGGVRGFFHPDNFTFGSALYLSRLIAAVMAVKGVQSVTAHKFQRLGRLPQGELAAGVIRPSGFEVLELDDDPSFPERGKLALTIGGGR